MNSTLKQRLENFFFNVKHYDYWNVGLIEGGTDQLISNDEYHIKWYRLQTDSTYLADPFVFHKEGKDFIFVEEYDYATKKGHISVIYDWNKPPRKIIDEPYHLSYPFLLEENGKLYMIPEASESGKVYYYSCQNFPFEWRKEGVLIDEKIFDPTFLKWDDKYWLFYTKPHQVSSELYLRYSDQLTGEWKEHSANPVKVAAKICRPAGPFFFIDNVIYRPSQDSTNNYGDNVILNKITDLTTHSYSEEQVKIFSLRNQYPYIGTHHVSHTKYRLVIDGRKTVKEFKGVLEIMKSVIAKFRRGRKQ